MRALRHVDLEIPQGSFVAIEGESGGGKSTLLNILGLLDSPSSGSFSVDGTEVGSLSDKDAAAFRSDSIAFVFQSFHLLDRRTVIDNVALPLHYRRVDETTRRARAVAALAAVGLERFAEGTPRTMSGGQRQRVAVARALASGAPIVLADEPTGNLDSVSGAAVLDSFDRVRADGATLIVVTHSPVVAARAERRVFIEDGVAREAAPSIGEGEADPTSARPHSVPPGRASAVRITAAARDAWENVTSRRGRMLGLLVTIVLSLALTVTTLGLADSARTQVSSDFDVVTSTEVSIRASGDGVAATLPQDATETVERLQSLNGMASVSLLSDTGAHHVRTGPPRIAVETGIYEGYGDLADSLRLTVNWAGRALALSSRTVLVGANLAENIGLADVARHPTIELDGEILTVVGLISKSPRAPDLLGKIVRGSSDSRQLTGDVSIFLVTHAGAARHVAHEAPLAIDAHRPGRFDVDAPVELNEVRDAVQASVATSLMILTAVALLGAVAFVTIATITSVGERRAEIGLRRALGARRRHISWMLIMESSFLGLVGGVTGVFVGMGAILTITLIRHWTPVFDPRLGAITIGIGLVISCLGALAGSVRAARIEPSEALRS